MGRTTSLTWGQYRRFLEEWSRAYLATPRSWRIDGRPVCAVNNLTDFVALYGQATFAVMLRFANKVVKQETGVAPYLLGVVGETNMRNVRLANALPIDGLTGYGLLPNWLGEPVQDYRTLVRERIREWEEVQKRIRIPFYPVVCAGWDASVRGTFRGRLRGEDGYPYSPVVTGVTAALFGEFLDHALVFNRRWQPRENIVFLHAWNEWSESSVLEPSDRFGYGFLEEVSRRALLTEMPLRVSMVDLPEAAGSRPWPAVAMARPSEREDGMTGASPAADGGQGRASSHASAGE